MLRIRIHRIHVFLGLLDPDPDLLVRSMDPDPSIINSKKTLISTVFDFLPLKNDVKGQRHGSADPDPDPHQNVMDPQP